MRTEGSNVLTTGYINSSTNPYLQQLQQFKEGIFFNTTTGRYDLVIRHNDVSPCYGAVCKYLEIMAVYYPDEKTGFQVVKKTLTFEEMSKVYKIIFGKQLKLEDINQELGGNSYAIGYY